MSLTGTITFKFGGDRADENVDFSVGAEEEGTLRAYLREVTDLEAFILRGGVPRASFRMNWQAGGLPEFSGVEPSDDQRAAFLHRLRPFLLEDEATYFNRVRGVVARSSESAFLQEYLHHTKDRFTLKKSRGQFTMVSNDLVINSETALNLWLYSKEYHRDVKKAADLEEAHTITPIESSRPIFVMMLFEKAEAIRHLGHVVYKMLQV